MLIFGSPKDSPTSSSVIVDALNLSVNVDNSNNVSCSKSNLCPKQVSFVDPDIEIQIPQCRKKYLHRSKTAPTICNVNEYDHPSMTRPPQLASPSIFVGAGVMHFVENLGWLDCFYLSVMSVTTVGYGDKAFSSTTGCVFTCVWLLVSTLAVARALLYLAEARVDKRHRRMVKWVLGQDLTAAQFLAADIDNNGSVSKAEFVIYKLKEMGKVTEKEILQI